MVSLDLINHIGQSIHNACLLRSNIDPSVLDLEGMSCKRTRHLFNNLASNIDNYMEVGSYKGSTICSAISNNNLKNAYYFENFSEFEDRQNKEALETNVDRYKGQTNVEAFYEDFFLNIQSKNIRNVDMFFYDGAHAVGQQFSALPISHMSMARYFIYIIDDWFCEVSMAKLMTWKSIEKFGFNIISFTELPSLGMSLDDGFHGGLGIFVIENLKHNLDLKAKYVQLN